VRLFLPVRTLAFVGNVTNNIFHDTNVNVDSVKATNCTKSILWLWRSTITITNRGGGFTVIPASPSLEEVVVQGLQPQLLFVSPVGQPVVALDI